MKYRDGPGAGRHPAKAGRNTRRASDGSRFLLGRPSSVSRALQIIGDKWSFMVVREGFFGNRRYDKILTELAIAPNILTDRLSRLVANGVFHRRQYQSSPDRYEYLLTDMGRDLYGPFIAMLRWGDRWLAKGKPPLLLKHLTCGHDFHAEVDLRPLQAADRRRRHAVPAGLRSQVLRRSGASLGRLTSGRSGSMLSTSLKRMILPEPVRGISATKWVASGIL